MALYNKTAFGAPYKIITKMQTGTTPQYLFGNYCSDTQPWRFQILDVACTSNVATATVQLVRGGGGTGNGVPDPIPAVGAVMGVMGTTSASGAFNVDPTTVSSITLNSSGAGTITYPCTTANLATRADSGSLIVHAYEYPDLVSSGSASAALAQAFTPDDSDNARCLFCDAVWSGTMPTAATVVLQAANVDQDSRYVTLLNSGGTNVLASVAGSAVVQNGAEYSFIMSKFLRAKVLSMTGGDSTTGLVVTLFA